MLALALFTGLTAPSLALAADDTIKIGLLATFEGPFTVLGEDGERGAMTAVDEMNGTVAGKKIEIVKGSSDASPDSAVRAARKLVEQDGVKVLVGPLSGDEGIAVKDYAKTQPNVTFINGTSAAQDTTLRDPAENFFRFSTDGAQWMAGLGTYAFNDKGYKKVATVAEDYSFPYTQVFGFMAEFCKAGGHVPSKSWVPIGNKDFSSVIAAIPDDVDAIYVALGGADAVNFLTQYQQAGGTAPLIGGSITVDQTVLTSKGKLRDVLIGTPSAGPTADTNDAPAWKTFVEAYKKQPGAFPSPSLFAHGYYVDMKATLLGARQGRRRCLRRRREAARRAVEALLRHADRQGLARQEPQRHRRHLPDRSHRRRRRQSLQQAGQGRAAGQPDARHSRRRVPEARRGQPRQSELQVTTEA